MLFNFFSFYMKNSAISYFLYWLWKQKLEFSHIFCETNLRIFHNMPCTFQRHHPDLLEKKAVCKSSIHQYDIKSVCCVGFTSNCEGTVSSLNFESKTADVFALHPVHMLFLWDHFQIPRLLQKRWQTAHNHVNLFVVAHFCTWPAGTNESCAICLIKWFGIPSPLSFSTDEFRNF